MGSSSWSFVFVGVTFALYIGIAIWTRARTTAGFYVAGRGISPLANGMATAADWMSAASFLSMAGLISFVGYDGATYLMGWTGGYVLLAVLLVPYLRRFGKFTVPAFVGDRYGSDVARVVAVVCALFVSFTYIAGQMRGVGVVFSRFLDVGIDTGVLIGTAIVFFYAVLGGMRGITYTQVAQYCVLIIAYLVPAVAISQQMTGSSIPQIGFGGTLTEGPGAGLYLLDVLDDLHRELGFPEYTASFVEGKTSMIAMLAVTLTLMVGTAGLPHVLVRFYTVSNARAARYSAVWALAFIAILYTTAPAIAAFARVNLIHTLHDVPVAEAPAWFETWRGESLIRFEDLDGDGRIDYSASAAVNELTIDKDIMVLANPEIANLPAWVVGLVVAGGLAAALSTAAGLLMVISSAVSHDLCKVVVWPRMPERTELLVARTAAAGAVVVAAWFGIHPPGFVAETVALAFGLAAASFFPVLVLGVFSKRVNKFGAIAGMVTGLTFTSAYIAWFAFQSPKPPASDWWFGIGPTGIGIVGAGLHFLVAILVSRCTPAPSIEQQAIVDRIREPERMPSD